MSAGSLYEFADVCQMCVCVFVFVCHTLLPFMLLCRGHAGIGKMAALLDGFRAQLGKKQESQRGSDFSIDS